VLVVVGCVYWLVLGLRLVWWVVNVRVLVVSLMLCEIVWFW